MLDANRLPPEIKSELLAQIQNQIGDFQYHQLVYALGEDGLIEHMISVKRESQESEVGPARRVLSAKELKIASRVGGGVFGLALGGVFALGIWLLQAGFGVPYWNSAASLFYAMPLVLCVAALRAWLQKERKPDFRSHLLTLALVGLVGGLIGACRWGCESHGSLSGAILSHTEGTFGAFMIIGLVLFALSWGKVDPTGFAMLLTLGVLGIAAVAFVLVDAPQGPAGVSKALEPFLLAKVGGLTSLFGLLLGSVFPIQK